MLEEEIVTADRATTQQRNHVSSLGEHNIVLTRNPENELRSLNIIVQLYKFVFFLSLFLDFEDLIEHLVSAKDIRIEYLRILYIFKILYGLHKIDNV